MKILNRIVRTVNQNSIFEDATNMIDSSSTFNQGDLLCFAGNKIRASTAGDLGDTFVGISRVSVVNGVLKQPYTTDVSANTGKSEIAGPVYGVVAKLVLKTGDALNPGQAVCLNPADGAYHVTSVPPVNGVAIGIYQGPVIAAATAGQEIEVHLGCCYPTSTFKA